MFNTHTGNKMFKIGDKVSFGVRFSNGVRKGGIARLNGQVTKIDIKKITVQQLNGQLYNFRELKGGWVVDSERDDPKGRLYLKETAE